MMNSKLKIAAQRRCLCLVLFTFVYPDIKQKHLANFMLNVIDSLPMPYTSLIRNQGAEKESESSSFPQLPAPRLRLRRTLSRSLATRGCSQL